MHENQPSCVPDSEQESNSVPLTDCQVFLYPGVFILSADGDDSDDNGDDGDDDGDGPP